MLESDPRLAVIIPVYNEAENILASLTEIDTHTPVPTTVYVVGDMEDDTTFPVAREFVGKNIEIQTVLNGYGRGALNAIKWGLHQAPESALLVSMADLSDDLAQLGLMWEHYLSGSGVVCASRYMPGGRQIGGPVLKGFLSRIAGLSLHYLAGLPTRDVTNSFKLYSKDVINAIEIESRGGFEIGMEIVVKAWGEGFTITEVPATWRDRTAGESRFRLIAWLPNYLQWYFYCLKLAYLGPRKASR